MKNTDKEFILAKTALLAGFLILSCGGETLRAEDTATRILLAGGAAEPEVTAYSTSISISFVYSNGEVFSMTKRIRARTIHLSKITRANEISRNFCQGRIDIYEAHEQLIEATKMSGYSNRLIQLCTLLTPATFTILLGGSLLDCIFSGVLGIFLLFGAEFQKKTYVHPAIYNFALGTLAAASGYLISAIPSFSINLDIVLPGTMMALLPGVTITNGVHDMLNADFMSGSARFVEALVTAATLAVGIGFGLGIGAYLTGGAL
jgi:uncharacterized membrane protein YjjP (DUF1212 family)